MKGKYPMQYQVFVQADAQPPTHFVASVVGVPNLSVVGATEAEAMANVRVALEQKLAMGKFVAIEVGNGAGGSSEIPPAGAFEQDETFDDWMEKLAEIRRAANVWDDVNTADVTE
jgi:predicted RNase H-like HicB family nuclease